MKKILIALCLAAPLAAHATKLLVDSPDIRPARPIGHCR